MALSLDEINRSHRLLKEYNGENPYLISLKNSVYVYKTKTLNKFESEFILRNYNREPLLVNKIISIIEWWGKKKQEDWGLEFTPSKLKMTYYLGDTSDFYCFYCFYRKSQDKACLLYTS